jgi:hypothetical protein
MTFVQSTPDWTDGTDERLVLYKGRNWTYNWLGDYETGTSVPASGTMHTVAPLPEARR